MISPLNRGVKPGGGVGPSGNQAVALRVAVIGAVLLGLFAIVFFRLWYLQVLSGDSLAAAATQNRKRTVAITAPRGDIVDRAGKVIVRNKRPSIVELAPGSLPSLERAAANEYGQRLGKWFALSKKERAGKQRPRIIPLTDASVRRAYVEDGEEDELAKLEGRYDRLGKLLELPADEVRRRVINKLYLLPYANVPLRQNASADVVGYIAENSELYEGVSTTARYVRSYASNGAGAQFLGQVGAVPTDEDGKVTDSKFRNLPKSTMVGRNGLEYQYDAYLRGEDGKVVQNIDAMGNVVGEPTVEEPRAGQKLQLTIDLDLQNRAQELISGGSRYNPGGLPGAAVALDPKTGEVLASVSGPTFNPNIFTRPVSDEEFEKFIDENSDKPLFNRVTEAAYPAASTFKVVTSFAALATGVTTASAPFNDTGDFDLGDRIIKNAQDAIFGSIDMVSALEVSSDVYYYAMGARMNQLKGQPLQTWARRLGYGHRTGIDLPGERSGVIPDRKWRDGLAEEEAKCRREADPPIPAVSTFNVYTAAARGCGITDMRPWSIGDQVNSSVGQGDVQVSPLQSAVAYSAIENGGKIVRPHLARAVLDRQGATVQKFPSTPRREITLDQGALDTVRQGLLAAANGDRGTSTGVFKNWPRERYPVHGKTGTAETPKGDQSWYAAYVPDKDKPIVVVVTIEQGGFGAEKAAPIAAEMLKQWYGVKTAEIAVGEDTSN